MFPFLIMLGVSIPFIIFGLRLLLQKGYAEEKFGHGRKDKIPLTKGDILYYKYFRGILSVLIGLIILIVGAPTL